MLLLHSKFHSATINHVQTFSFSGLKLSDSSVFILCETKDSMPYIDYLNKALFASLTSNRSCKTWGNLEQAQISPLVWSLSDSSLGKSSLSWPSASVFENTLSTCLMGCCYRPPPSFMDSPG